MTSLPRGWTDVALGDVAEQVRGVSYKKDEAASSPGPDRVPVLRAGNLRNDGRVDTSDLVWVPKNRVSDRQRLQPGDVIVATSSGSLDVVGKAARYEGDLQLSFGAFCKVMRPAPGVDKSYFGHYFQTASYRRIVSSLAAGANINNLKNSHLDDLRFPLPPLEEQRRIAATLDKADELRAKRRAALEQLDTLTQAIFLDMFGDPAEHPRAALGETTSVVTKGTTPTTIGFDFSSAGIGFVRAQDLTGGALDASALSLFVDEAADDALARSRLLPSDVLISIAGTIGRCAIVPSGAGPLNCNQAVALVRGLEGVTPRFLLAWLKTQDAQRQMSGSQVTGTISNLSLGRIKDLQLPIPSLCEQSLFEQRADGATTVGARIQASGEALDRLSASLQSRAFRGEL